MIGNPNTTQRQQFDIDQRVAREKDARVTLWMVMTRPVPEGLITTIPSEAQIAAKRRKLGFA